MTDILEPADLPLDPFALLPEWLPANDDPARPLMTLATLDEDGGPDVRSVLLSGWDEAGFTWHTDSRSRKVAQATASPQVALCVPLLGIPGPSDKHQLVIRGLAEQTSPEEQDLTYRRRSAYLQQLAWQNTPAFAALPQPERVAQWSAFPASLPEGFTPPETWIGFRVRPIRMTFWFGADDTASRRVEYTLRDGVWERQILAG